MYENYNDEVYSHTSLFKAQLVQNPTAMIFLGTDYHDYMEFPTTISLWQRKDAVILEEK